MKNIAPNRKIKNKVRTLVEFKTLVKEARFKEKAIVTLCDKKHNVFSGDMFIGSFIEACELCRKSEISLVSYQAIYSVAPKKVRLITKAEYEKEMSKWT